MKKTNNDIELNYGSKMILLLDLVIFIVFLLAIESILNFNYNNTESVTGVVGNISGVESKTIFIKLKSNSNSYCISSYIRKIVDYKKLNCIQKNDRIKIIFFEPHTILDVIGLNSIDIAEIESEKCGKVLDKESVIKTINNRKWVDYVSLLISFLPLIWVISSWRMLYLVLFGGDFYRKKFQNHFLVKRYFFR